MKDEIKELVVMLKEVINDTELVEISDVLIMHKAVELYIFKNGESCKLDGTASFGKIEDGKFTEEDKLSSTEGIK